MALKLRPVPAGLPEGGATRLLDEGRLLARVRHPNVVDVHGASIADGRVGLWMELVKGKTLARIVSEQGPMSAEEAAVIGMTLCRALAAVHGAGLLHRDIKAQNVMREERGRIVLMDLNLGREQDVLGLDAWSDLAGTPVYMPPEVLDGGPATVEGDIYSLGVLLYYLVTGTHPLRGKTMADVRAGHASGRRRLLGDVRSDLPKAFMQAVERATAAAPTERFESAAGMEIALAQSIGVPSTAGNGSAPSPLAEPVVGPVPAPPARWLARHRSAILTISCVLLLVAVVALRFWPSRQGANLPSAPLSVIVLPLDDRSPDAGGKDRELYAEQMTEQLITGLTRFGQLSVVSTLSTMRYKGFRGRLGDIARELGVQRVILGSLRVQGPSLQMTLEIVDPGTERNLGALRYEAPIEDWLNVPRRAAVDLAERSGVQVTESDRREMRAQPQVPGDALESYLRGWDLARTREEPKLQAALSHFQEAIRLYPQFAQAYAGAAEVYAALALGGFGSLEWREAYSKAGVAAARALEIDDTLASARLTSAWIEFFLAWNWDRADLAFAETLNRTPNYAKAHWWYSDYLNAMGRAEEALDHAKRATVLDPLNASYSRDVAWVLFFSRRYADALEQLDRASKLSPQFVPTRTLQGRAYAELGQTDEAIRILQHVVGEQGEDRYLPMLAYAYARAGRSADAQQAVSRLVALGDKVSPYSLALVYVAMGSRSKAMESLERAFDDHDSTMVNLRADPRFDLLRGEERYKRIERRMHFPG
jgi:tetratricopeptide (TPR) repeat protein